MYIVAYFGYRNKFFEICRGWLEKWVFGPGFIVICGFCVVWDRYRLVTATDVLWYDMNTDYTTLFADSVDLYHKKLDVDSVTAILIKINKKCFNKNSQSPPHFLKIYVKYWFYFTTSVFVLNLYLNEIHSRLYIYIYINKI